jgi:hypothetical protein
MSNTIRSKSVSNFNSNGMAIDHLSINNWGVVVGIWMISRVMVNDKHLDMAQMIFAVFEVGPAMVGPLHLAINRLFFYIDICGFLEVS